MPRRNQLQAGVARRIITPPKGIFLIGYGDRTKGNTGIHDDLTTTALVLNDGKTNTAIVALDMLCINEFVVDRLRTRVGSDTEVLLCCSHTHSGPIAYADAKSKQLNRNYIESLVDSIADSITEASSQLSPAQMKWSQGEAGIAVNRRERQPDGHFEIGRNPDGPVDKSLNIVSVLTLDDKRLATVVNYACHGTVLGPDNYLVSADWIGAMRAKVEKDIGGLLLFLQGATGDLNPDMYWNTTVAFQKMQEEGESVAEAIKKAITRGSETINSTPLEIARAEAWIPLETAVSTPNPPKNEYRSPLLKMAGLPVWMGFAVDYLLGQRYPWKPRIETRNGFWSVPLRINAMRIGDLGLVAFGAEVFTEIGMKVKTGSPAIHTLFVSITDGCISYLHTTSSHSEGGYEVDSAPYAYRYPGRLAANSEQIALEAVRALQEDLWRV